MVDALPPNGNGLTFRRGSRASVPDRPVSASIPASFLRQNIPDVSQNWRGAPPGMGKEVLPHVFSVAGRIGTAGRIYPFYDQATEDSRQNAEMMRAECGVMECLEARQRGTALLPWHIEPEDEKNEEAKELAEAVSAIVAKTWNFLELRRNLLEAIWYGRYLTSHRFATKRISGAIRASDPKWQTFSYIDRWTPRNGDKIVFRYDDGTGEYDEDEIGIRIGGGYRGSWTIGDKIVGGRRVNQVETNSYYGLVYWLSGEERKRVALHRHLIEDGTFYDIRSLGRVQGVGVRDRIYWTWYAMQQTLAHALNYIERNAHGIEIWRFPAGNPQIEAATIEAANNRSNQSVVLVPVQPGELADLQTVEVIEPGFQGLESLMSIITDYFGHKIKRYILGQTLTSEAEATGLGSGVADAHMATYGDIVAFDAEKLEECLTNDLVRQIQLFNYPRTAHIELKLRLDTESEDMGQKLEAWERAWNMGLELPASDVAGMIGSRVADGSERTLANPAFQQGGMMGGGPLAGLMQAGQDARQQTAGMGDQQWKPGTKTTFPPMGGAGGGGKSDSTIQQHPAGEQAKYSAAWDESKHPRDEGGRFSGSNSQGATSTKKWDSGPDLEFSLESKQHDAIGEWLAEKAHISTGLGSLKKTGISLEQAQKQPVTDDDKEMILFAAGELGGEIEDALKESGAIGGESITLAKFLMSYAATAKKVGTQAKRDKAAERIPEDAKIISFRDKDGRRLMLHPATRADRTSDWQLTSIWDNGLPSGHVNPKSREDGIWRALGISDDPYWNEHGYEIEWTDKDGTKAPYSRRQLGLIASKYTRTADQVDAAASRVLPPSERQAEAGNYRKGKIQIHGLPITIETPRGQRREGHPDWPELPVHYGYIRRTEDRDGDHLDCFIGPHPESEIVFVVDQETQRGRFDEHKAMLGFFSERDAIAAYRASYSPGWRVGPVTSMTVEDFKRWIEKGDLTKRIEKQVGKYSAKNWDESEHPRDDKGRFSESENVVFESESDDPKRYEKQTEKWNKQTPESTYDFGKYKIEFYPEEDDDEVFGYLVARDSENKVVGNLFFGMDDEAMKGSVEVHPEHRRKGIASKMYQIGEEISGKSFTPEESHTPLAEALWNQPNRPFGSSKSRDDSGRFVSLAKTSALFGFDVPDVPDDVERLRPESIKIPAQLKRELKDEIDSIEPSEVEASWIVGGEKLKERITRLADKLADDDGKIGDQYAEDVADAWYFQLVPPEWVLSEIKGGPVKYARYKSQKGQQSFDWVTIGGHPEGDKKHADGTPVKIEKKTGKIVQGPDSLEGRDLDDIDQDKAGTARDKRRDAKPPQRPQAEPTGKQSDSETPIDNVKGGGKRFQNAKTIGDIREAMRPDETLHFATYGGGSQWEVRREKTSGGQFGGGLKRGIVATFQEQEKSQEEQQPSDDPSTWTPEQKKADWKQHGVRSKAFKSWFGDWENDPANSSKVVDPETGEPQEQSQVGGSKVVDSSGQPLMMHHGTSWGGFEKFEKRWGKATGGTSGGSESLLYGPGFYFTDSDSVAKTYSELGADWDDYGPEEWNSKIEPSLLDSIPDDWKLQETPRDGLAGPRINLVIPKGPESSSDIVIPIADEWVPGKWTLAEFSLKQLQRIPEARKLMQTIEGHRKKREVKSVYLNIRNPYDPEKRPGDEHPQGSRERGNSWPKAFQAIKLEETKKQIAEAMEEAASTRRDVEKARQETPEDFAPGGEWEGTDIEYLRNADDMEKWANAKQKMIDSGDIGGAIGHHYFPSYNEIVREQGGKEQANEWLRSMGYDGITHTGGQVMGKEQHRVWIAFEPNQIKSTDNEGTFDPSDERMRYTRRHSATAAKTRQRPPERFDWQFFGG